MLHIVRRLPEPVRKALLVASSVACAVGAFILIAAPF